MKVRCVIYVDLTDEQRRNIRAHYGETGIATRDEIKELIEMYGGLGNPDWSDILNPGKEDELGESELEGGYCETRNGRD